MTEPWMTQEEAQQWVDAALKGIRSGDQLLVLYERELLELREPLQFDKNDRERAATMFEEDRDKFPQFRVHYNVLTFCVALLRAVKS